MKKIVLIFLFAFSFSACEKDDICDPTTTATTPKMVVEFYEKDSPTVLKNVTNLVLDTENVNDSIKLASGTKVLVPLKITDDTVTYKFIQNGGTKTLTDDNTDIITVNYTRINTYVSRACGYKTTFELKTTTGIVLTDNNPIDNLWIQQTSIKTAKINNETEIHVKILF